MTDRSDDLRAWILDELSRLRIYEQKGKRRPHKPLLLLVALERLRRGERRLRLDDVADLMKALLGRYAPPIKNQPQPHYPFWHLGSSKIWMVDHARDLAERQGDTPSQAALRRTKAGFAPEVADALLNEPALLDEAIATLLHEYFPTTLHEQILQHIGLDPPTALVARERSPVWQLRRQRDPVFRRRVLEAYDHRCAVTGFRAALSGVPIGCEAAHVRWHAERGPDAVENGLCLEPTLHLLFDAGAWTLTDDRRVIVSARFEAEGEAFARLRERHGRRIRDPERGGAVLSAEYIRWHREADRGGVFREPGLGV